MYVKINESNVFLCTKRSIIIIGFRLLTMPFLDSTDLHPANPEDIAIKPKKTFEEILEEELRKENLAMLVS